MKNIIQTLIHWSELDQIDLSDISRSTSNKTLYLAKYIFEFIPVSHPCGVCFENNTRK